MATKIHMVRQGDTLLSIAARYGFASWERIWEHADNAALRELREDPQVLAVGDEIAIPDPQLKEHGCETGSRHTFVLERIKAWYRSIVLDEYGEPMTDAPFRLELDGEVLTGTTDGEAKIELPIDPRPTRATLVVTHPDGRTLTWKLELGALEPVDLLVGVKARLSNLGFSCGAINSQMNPETRRALRDFQVVYRLPITGEADEATRRELLAAHDKR